MWDTELLEITSVPLVEFGGSVWCTWVCGMRWCTSWLQSVKVNFFMSRLPEPTTSSLACSCLPSHLLALCCTVWCQLLVTWGAEGFRELWCSRAPTVLQSRRCCTALWNASGAAEFHVLSAFPKSGTQLQKSWQLSTLNCLGIRHLFLWKNSQGFKIA